MEALMKFIATAAPWLNLAEMPLLIAAFVFMAVMTRKNREAVQLLALATTKHKAAIETHTAAAKAATEAADALAKEREKLHELVKTLTGAKGVIVGVALHPVLDDSGGGKPH